jgi:hypothetical protein
MRRIVFVLTAAALVVLSSPLVAQNPGPSVRLLRAPTLRFTGQADSNSPAVRDIVGGQRLFYLMTSVDGRPSTAVGSDVSTLGQAQPADLEPWPGGGVWMEAIVADADGTWYGYYHNENLATACKGTTKMAPRIGAARSRDHGATWESLGIVLEAPPFTSACVTNNKYFVGGVGDFSVILDQSSQDLYFFVSQYYRLPSQQGVAEARLAWADRDAPAGKAMVWQTRTWLPATRVVTAASGASSIAYRVATPLFPTLEPFHDPITTSADVFWGPSVHYNTYLNQYVMLLNRAKDENFSQEGIYVSYSHTLDDPRSWSPPEKILDGGSWYPQVIGLERDGTDKRAGRVPRFFMSGRSDYLIQFNQ